MISRFKIRFAATLWLAGMVSIALVAIFVVPSLVAGRTLPLPIWAISASSFAQGGVFLALTVWAGCALAPKLGLRAPVFEALAGSWIAWRIGRRCVFNRDHLRSAPRAGSCSTENCAAALSTDSLWRHH